MRLFTVDQAAKELNLSPIRVRQFCQRGRIGQRIGGRWIITRRELDKFMSTPRPTGRPRSVRQ